ncbi:MAG: ROK family glucokinase [Tyzzerella sp.]|nr:ROK family glucokinase [Tyzzerella sp.]
MKYCFGVDVGGTTVKMGLFQTDSMLLDKWEIPTRKDLGEDVILSDVANAIREKMAEHGIRREDVVGIGVGVPAAVTGGGFVEQVANLGWTQKDVKKELEELTGIEVKVENDANVAALGEMWKGGGEGYRNLVMVTLGTGVGGGIIVNGQILTGTNGGGGEIGHILADRNETECCGCGKKGCLEQYASATGIARLARRKLAENSKQTILNADEVSAKTVFDAVKAGDEVATQVAEQFGAYLGYALADLGAVLDPEIFVIGGGVSKAGEILFTYVKKYYQERTFFTCKDVKFALAKLGNDAGIYGAAKLVIV